MLAKGETHYPLFVCLALVLICLLVAQAGQAAIKMRDVQAKFTALEGERTLLTEQVAELARTEAVLRAGTTEMAALINELQTQIEELTRPIVIQPLKRAYLTFDDGPSANTLAILDILAHYRVYATFFVNGNNTQWGQDVYRRIVAEGHTLGNHSYSHNYSRIYASVESYLEDHQRLEDLLFAATGVRPNIVRFPGGSNNTVSHQYGGIDIMSRLTEDLLARGYQYFDWNITALDASAVTQERDEIIYAVVSRLKDVATPVILLHDSSSKTTTVEALPAIIDELLRLGFSCEALQADSFTIHFR